MEEQHMSGRVMLGIALIVFGALVIAYQGFSYTTQKKAVDMGPIQVNKTEHHSIFLPPILGAIALVGGVVVLFIDRRAR
jgi:drug/metabolite transporter (DMT)-like permease